MSNPIRVYLPFNQNVIVSIFTAAAFLQRVTLTYPDGTSQQFIGNGEDNVLANFILQTTDQGNRYGFPVDVTIEYSSDLGRTYQLSCVRKERMHTDSVRSTVISSDDGGGDEDFNDAVVVFTWLQGM